MNKCSLIVGEVRTQLLQNSTELGQDLCCQVLGLRADERPRTSLRPIAYAVSPDLLGGVDCRLANAPGTRTRGVGTARGRVAISGGRVIQSSCHAVIVDGPDHRLPWSHYLARPGVIEVIGKRPDWSALATGFLTADDGDDVLDLGEMSGRLMDRVQSSKPLDRRPPFKIARTRLRWVLETGGDTWQARLVLVSGTLRTLHLRCPDDAGPAMAALCEDLALHDWLLSSLLLLSEKARIGASSPSELARLLAPANHLMHLWMPAAHVDKTLRWPWAALEKNPGFTRQWEASVNRIRDQIAIKTLDLLSSGDNALEKRNHRERD